MRIWVLITGLIIIFFGCNNRSSTSLKENIIEDTIVPQGIKPGILNNLTAQTDPGCRYGLYVPKDSLKEYPLIVIFDPHAAGNHAASQYQELAEKYKIILAASNNIQNGMPSNQFVYYANCIIDDVMNLVPIDSEFVYLMGFSGGARVASFIAQSENVFRGMIGCGAGTVDIANIQTTNFLYVGFAGFNDFNFLEVYKTENVLRQSHVAANFKYFEGKHEWPPDSIMEYAFAALSLNMKKKPEPYVKKYIESELIHCKSIPIRDAWKKLVNYKSLKDLIENHTGLDMEKGKVHEYLGGYESKTAEKNLNNSFVSEAKGQTEIQNAFNEKDIDWWKKKISVLYQAIDKKDKSPSDYRDIRLLSYISMNCYMHVNSSLNNNDNTMAQKFLTIYNLADPTNPDVTYFYGVLLAQNNKFQESIDSLSSAIKKGYADVTKWNNERAFLPLKDSLRFIDLESRLGKTL